MEQEGVLGGCGCPVRSDAREMFVVSCRLSEPESWADCSGGLWTPPPSDLRGQLMSGECVWHWMGPGARATPEAMVSAYALRTYSVWAMADLFPSWLLPVHTQKKFR